MSNISSNEAWQKLLEGNRRFAEGKPLHPNQSTQRREEVTKGQNPFAVIVGCSDSRIPPEILFDQGIGDIFVIRVAGNIVDDVELGSIEYAVDHLGTPIVVVLGHGQCGAVTATAKGGDAHGHIASIAKIISPAVEKAKGQPGDLVENAIRINTEMVVSEIMSSSKIVSDAAKEGKVKVFGAYYNIETGEVTAL